MRAHWLAVLVLASAGCDPADADGRTRDAPPVGAEARWLRAGWTPPAPLQASQRGPEACPVQQAPAFALRGDGVLIAVWHDGTAGDLAPLVWPERRPGQSVWSAPQPVLPDARGYWQDGPPRLSALPDGSLALAWQAATDASKPRATRMAALGRGGQAWSLTAPPVESAAPSLSLAHGPDGLHAVWSGRDSPLHSRRGPDGRWSQPDALRPPGRTVSVRVTGGPSPQQVRTRGASPVLAAAPGGALLAAWWDDERTLDSSGAGEWDLVARVYDPATRTWSAPALVAGGRSEEPAAVAAAGRDGFILAFTSSERRLQVVHRPFSSGRWSRPESVPGQGDARAFEPGLASGPDGSALLTWRSFVVGGSTQFGAALHGGGPRFARLPPPPPGDPDLSQHGGLFNAAGAPTVWFDDPAVRQGCAGVAISEMKG